MCIVVHQLEHKLDNGNSNKKEYIYICKSNLFLVFLASSGRAKGSTISGHVLETDG